MIVTTDNLNDVMEFDRVIRVHADGTVTEPTDVDGPEYVYQECDAEGSCVDDVMHGADGWEFLRGYTGQYSYNGPVMHQSEFIGGGLARDILSTPRLYVAVPVYAEGENEIGEAFGWAIAYREIGSLS